MGVLVRDGLMPVVPTPVRHRRQRSGVTVLRRYLSHHALACPRLTPNVGKAEEGERGTIRLRMISPIWSVGVLERGKGTGWIAWEPERSRSRRRESKPGIGSPVEHGPWPGRHPPTFRERERTLQA